MQFWMISLILLLCSVSQTTSMEEAEANYAGSMGREAPPPGWPFPCRDGICPYRRLRREQSMAEKILE